jgi:hypothetical protein
MPNTQIGIIDLDFVNCRRAQSDMGGSGSNLAVVGDYGSIFALDTKLAALNGTYYTQTRLDSMTSNDKVFALRNMQDATSIASYMTNSSA